MEHYEECLERKTLFQGRVFNIHLDTVRLQDNTTSTREVVEHHGGVAVLALDENDNLLMVEQYRYGADRVMLELPAGKIDPGESPETCGVRELEEETGYQAEKFMPFGKFYPTPAYDTETIYLYVAEDLVKTEQNLDPGEFIDVKKVPFAQAVELCKNGTIEDAKTTIAILRYAAQRLEQN